MGTMSPGDSNGALPPKARPASVGINGAGTEPENRAPLVTATNVSKRFGRTLALDDVHLEIANGELYALLGPNGAGKTTLIHILCTIQRADSGTVLINGIDVAKRPLAARRHLGVVFQESSLDTRLTVYEN